LLSQRKTIEGARLMDIADSHLLLSRFKRLETQVRIWQILGLLVLLMFGYSRTASVMAQQKSQPAPVRGTTVEAQNFLLKDASGAIMGQLTVKDGKAQLELYDPSGNVTWSTNPREIILGR
jgi:hypothetical protein